MITVKLREEYIKLGQAMKAAGLVSSGVEAKMMIQDGAVAVNGETEYQRGKKTLRRRPVYISWRNSPDREVMN